MSEYQYYEFLAIDRPLTVEETAVLREMSSRARITPVSFINEYNWGDFKGNPDKLMQRFFDAHVYVANWMTAIFMVRVPIEALSKKTVEAMAVRYILDFKATKTHWVITWYLEESQNYDRFGMEDGRGWMVRLAPVRDELLRGDIRSLYIGWLAAVAGEKMDDAEMEPLVVNGLGNLTAAQQALSEFLEVGPELLAGAGIGSPAVQDEVFSQKEMDEWIDRLSREDMTAVLKQLLAGKGHQAERSIKNRFVSWRRGVQIDQTATSRRTVGELLQNAEKARLILQEKQKRDRKRQEIKRRKERKAYLKNLSNDFSNAWESVRETRRTRIGAGL